MDKYTKQPLNFPLPDENGDPFPWTQGMYESNLVAVFSVNCTTINQEFNPNDPENDKLFDFDPIRYMCIGPPGSETYCKFYTWSIE